MKPLKMMSTVSVALIACAFLSSCGSGDEKKKEEEKKDTAAAVVETPPAPAKPNNVMYLSFKVKDYSKWLASYESHDSTRAAYGLKKFVVARGLEKDSNMIHVYMWMDDAAKARQMLESSELKERMMKSGVMGKPAVAYLDVQRLETTEAVPNRLVIHHKVKDYDAWLKEYDSDKPNREAAGLADRALSYSIGDNHDVYLVFVVSDWAKAKAFGDSKELKEKMEKAGVEGPPTKAMYTITKLYK